jgi:hypothetical protein
MLFPEGRRGGVFRLPSQSPQLRAADHPFFGFGFGYLGECHREKFKAFDLEVARGGNMIWDMNGDFRTWVYRPSLDLSGELLSCFCFSITCYPLSTVHFVVISRAGLPPL